MKSQLTVYKASAGSGKTFTLAREYMTMVIANPLAYRTILAVTFTNKATEEMKIRILGQLYGIAHQLPDSVQYLQQISTALPHLSIAQIEKNAGKALELLIHNYNYFRVMTIDTFFQSVLRNLARELDLTANLRIGLNDLQVEQQAVDELIESLENTDKLLFWIMGYIKENIEDDKNWNVIGQIKKFGENIFKDYYKDHADELSTLMSQEGFFEAFKSKMQEIKKKAIDQFDMIANTFFDALDEGGFTSEDLANTTKGIWSYFNKLRLGKYSDKDLITKSLPNYISDPKTWVRGDNKEQQPIYELVTGTLHKLLVFSEENRPKLAKMYKSAELTMRHLNQLRLLGSIDKKVRELNDEANRFLLSDTQTLLHSLIQDNDSPFIFEKIGTQLDHVMIDEFQDTSTIQWKNFKVLLEETMSREDAGNLIVGDVKQSIYRWRSGDWRLLNNIEQQFESIHHDIDIKTLDTNYRSDRNVVSFNNAFFVEAARLEYDALKDNTPEEAQQLKNAYADVEQKVPDSKPTQGYVKVELIKNPKNEDQNERMMQLCLDTVNELTAKGMPTNRIAIWGRTNGQIQNIAEYFMNHSDYEMVSDEAFRLDASQAVNTLVAALRHLLHPDDAITKATLQKYINTYLSEEGSTTSEDSTGSKIDFFNENRQQLLEMPLYDLVERIFNELKMGEIEDMKQQSAYVCAFYDKLNAFLVDNSSDIEAFLQEWDNELYKKSIHSDSEDGIRMLTVHKSKGLEYDTVIMPYCDWQLEKSNTTIWCTPQEAPYNELPLVPIDFSAGMMLQSVYEPDYYSEHLQNMVDNLNLLYVAFTRASHNLYVFGKRGYAGSRSCIIEKALPKVAEVLGKSHIPCQLEGIDQKTTEVDITFSYGEPVVSDEKKKKVSQNIFETPSKSITVNIHVNAAMPEFRQSIKSRDFIEGDEEEEQQKYYIKMGTVLHALFSTIQTRSDIEGALKDLELDGVLYDENISRDKVEAMIRKRLESPKVSNWFSDRWRVFNECSILKVENGVATEHRPDRVMQNDKETVVVDFKFGKPKPEYHNQVKEYMELLGSMGHKNVKGYLWYVYPNKIVEVE